MARTILFDLDGTLLPMDTDTFVHSYMKALATHMAHLVNPKVLIDQVLASTALMARTTDPNRTNARVFADDFFPKIGHAETELLPVFAEFYGARFRALSSSCPGLPGKARQVVSTALDLGYEIVLATNPIFPRKAIEERMRWIRVDDLPWALVTTYEEMHACKPQPAYFREVLDKIGRTPSDCIMVGNDVTEDGAAADLGIPVYFITDHLINRLGREIPSDHSGTLAKFQTLLRSDLPLP